MNNNYKNSQGFSMLELMIAMTLGLFLIAGVSSVYLSSKQTYAERDQVSELDENARVALRALRQHIAHAGYASTSGIVIQNYLLPEAASVTPASCTDGKENVISPNIIKRSADGDDLSGGDSIGLTFLADDALHRDCSNGILKPACRAPDSAIIESSYIYNSFDVRNGPDRNLVGDTIPVLYCDGSRGLTPVPWAEGIENIQFLFGVDRDANGSVENYWNATQITAAGLWDKIISVRAGILVRSLEPVYEEAEAKQYQLLDELITTNDRYRRGIFTTTIRLKNVVRRS